ncbi:substrate-binding periplasmic protein [Alteromonas gilva]|uniref:Solute-binding protein family 3/N-terminal domain-containing protein n=1 Tax=Alteromonas gilva TaxID=2987522 RepID=A0ABT5L7S6_9ALTE|nr:transporter substrate-binding domain-containing protein [Alteromonas gilva]MDC8831818.1 hypothetical protein [Alteromonas gilva]
MRRVSVCLQLLFLALITSAPPVAAKTYIVASQNFDYFPHYNFPSTTDKGYAWALLETFAASSGVTFEYVDMPVLRLQIELEKGNIDLVYPDHRTWTNPVNDNSEKIYSAPLTESLVGTFVKSQHYGRDISNVRKVAIVLGFSPLYWQDRISQGKVELLAVTDTKAAIYMAELNRADAFDMDYYVAQHMLSGLNDIDNYVLDPSLPVTVVEFCLSTLNNPELIAQINQFIVDNPLVIESLKAKYGIDDPNERLRRLKSGIH